MSTKRYKPEQVVNLLRQIEVEIANGKTTPQACRDAQIRGQTYYRWRHLGRRGQLRGGCSGMLGCTLPLGALRDSGTPT